MIQRTDAIVLRVSPFSRTSHMVTWLSADSGRMTTSIRGACRPKSTFLGQYDLFYTCELLYYQHERNGIHTAKECSPTDLRIGLRSNWRAAAIASWLSSLAEQVSQPHHDDSKLYCSLTKALDLLSEPEPDIYRILVSAELSFLNAAGLSPNLSLCPQCDPNASPARFCLQSGHWLCQHRPPLHSNPATISLPEIVVEALTSARDNFLIASEHQKAIPSVTRFLGLFLRSQLETDLQARAIALQTVDSFTERSR